MIGRLLVGTLCGVAALLGLIAVRGSDLVAAERRWTAGEPAAYRATVQLERVDGICVQQLEARRGAETRVLRDTCPASWLGLLTVKRMFELAERLEQPAECYPAPHNCICHRMRVGVASYSALGYPQTLVWQRDLRPNPLDLSFWRETARRQQVPDCSVTILPVRVRVLALEPLE